MVFDARSMMRRVSTMPKAKAAKKEEAEAPAKTTRGKKGEKAEKAPRKKAKKDPNAPRKPSGAYIHVRSNSCPLLFDALLSTVGLKL